MRRWVEYVDPNGLPKLTVKYEALSEPSVSRALQGFFGLPAPFVLPPRSRVFAANQNFGASRDERLARLSVPQRDALRQTYAAATAFFEELPDVHCTRGGWGAPPTPKRT